MSDHTATSSSGAATPADDGYIEGLRAALSHDCFASDSFCVRRGVANLHAIQRRLMARIDVEREDVQHWISQESQLSEAYIRIRSLVGALDPPLRLTLEQMYEYTEAKVAALLNKQEPRPGDFWLVWRQGGGPSTCQHWTEDSARKEAERLARQHRGVEFHVMRVVASVSEPLPALVWSDGHAEVDPNEVPF